MYIRTILFIRHMRESFLKVWKDPVWSKVISVGIITLLGLAYNFIVNGINYNSLINFLTFKVDLWMILISICVIASLQFLNKKNKKKEVETIFEYDEKTLALDIALFNKIRNHFLPQSQINWLKYQDFTRGFYNTKLDIQYEFIFESSNADFEFLNPDLENLKLILVQNIIDLDEAFTRYLFPASVYTMSIPREWETEQYERYCEAVDTIHCLVNDVSIQYDTFIKYGRKTLKV
jgi:cbb3-type cytochrome oxidase subunit 3